MREEFHISENKSLIKQGLLGKAVGKTRGEDKHVFITVVSKKIPFVLDHEKHHAKQYFATEKMWHCDNFCLMSKRGTWKWFISPIIMIFRKNKLCKECQRIS